MNWKLWLKGLASSVVGGAIGSIAVIATDPATLGTQLTTKEGLVKIGGVALAGAITATYHYLKQSPLDAKDLDIKK